MMYVCIKNDTVAVYSGKISVFILSKYETDREREKVDVMQFSIIVKMKMGCRIENETETKLYLTRLKKHYEL